MVTVLFISIVHGDSDYHNDDKLPAAYYGEINLGVGNSASHGSFPS
jgi:hypothetical protein